MSDSNEGRCLQNVTMTWNESRYKQSPRVKKMTVEGAAAPPCSPMGLGRPCPVSQSQGQSDEEDASWGSSRGGGREMG